MHLQNIASSFQRAFLSSFSWKKFFLVFPVVAFCGLLFIFAKSVTFSAPNWILLNLIFVPIFVSSGILLVLGVLLAKIYYRERKELSTSYRHMLFSGWDFLLGTSYLTMPIIFAYLLLWVVLGIFFLLKEIPYIGPSIGVFLSFAPFLLLLASILLAFCSLCLLFFITPAVAFRKREKRFKITELTTLLKNHFFYAILALLLGATPLLFVLSLLFLASWLTQLSYPAPMDILASSLQWFFIMLPFTAFLTPFMIFFFQFASESYFLLQKPLLEEKTL